MGFGKKIEAGNENKHPLKILVVDDDELNRRMMKVLFGREGYQVDLVMNGLEALDAVKYQRYDVVFMDLQMPVMDGVEASRRIREWEDGGWHTFIVALTASYIPEQGHILYDAGIDNYISKPFELEHIQRMLKYVSDSQVYFSSLEKKVETQPAVPADEVLDPNLGIRRVGGDRDVYRELLGDFINELPVKLDAFRTYFQERDMSVLGRAAHNLKGVSANLGATGLSECAGKLDKHCNEGYTELIEGSLLEVQTMGSRLLETARHFLAGTSTLEGLQHI